MNILFAIAALAFCIIGLSQGEAASIAESNRPRRGVALLLSILTFVLAIISIGLAWYWAVIIALPCAILIPMLVAAVISGTHSQWAIDNMCRYASEGYSEAKLMVWVFLGLVCSVISILIG